MHTEFSVAKLFQHFGLSPRRAQTSYLPELKGSLGLVMRTCRGKENPCDREKNLLYCTTTYAKWLVDGSQATFRCRAAVGGL